MNSLRILTFSFLACLLALQAHGQDFSRTITKKASFSEPSSPDNELRIYNINGSVTVEGYDGNEIQISANETIDGNDRQIEQAKRELKLVVEPDGKRLLVYLDAPFIDIRKDGDHVHYHIDRWVDDYDFLFDITVRVPRNTHIYASTINHGDLLIRDMDRSVYASNVNGGVSLEHIAGTTHARTVNGSITASYLKSPDQNSDYKTVNGTIKVTYPNDLSADIRFKSMHGDLYTDFKDIRRLKATIKKSKSRRNRGTVYRIDRFAPIRIGKGGPVYSFEVLNGDVYVQQTK